MVAINNVSGGDVMVVEQATPKRAGPDSCLSGAFRRTDGSQLGLPGGRQLLDCGTRACTSATRFSALLPICSHAHCPNPGATHPASACSGFRKNVKSTLGHDTALLPRALSLPPPSSPPPCPVRLTPRRCHVSPSPVPPPSAPPAASHLQ